MTWKTMVNSPIAVVAIILGALIVFAPQLVNQGLARVQYALLPFAGAIIMVWIAAMVIKSMVFSVLPVSKGKEKKKS